MGAETLRDILFLILLLCFSGLFSSAETSLTSVNRIRVRSLSENGDKRAKTLLWVLERPDKMLSVILIGNNIVNLYASALATSLTIRLFGSKAVGIATGILTLVVLVCGEVAPKTMARHNAEQMALAFAGPVRFLMAALTPFVVIVNILAGLLLRIFRDAPDAEHETLTQEELRTIVKVGHEEGVLESGEKEIIDKVFDFRDTLVRDIMIPRIDMTVVPEDADYRTVLEVFRKDKYTRIPVCRGTADTIVGIINVKDLLLRDEKKPFRLSKLMREPLFTYEQKKTAELMVEMRRQLSNIAIVLDDYGVTAGMVTMEDLLEEIVGEIRDEYDTDEMKPVRKTGPSEYRVDGNIRLADLNAALDVHLDSENYESAGGFVTEQLDRVPREGDVVQAGGLTFTVLSMDKNRVEELAVKTEGPDGKDGGEEYSEDSSEESREESRETGEV